MSTLLAEKSPFAAWPVAGISRHADAGMATDRTKAVENDVSTALRAGLPVVLIEEQGGYLIASARDITADTVNLFTRIGRGILMIAITPARALSLGLPLQPRQNARECMPLCTISIEAADGTTTGISAADRALTLRTAASLDCERSMLVSPGHIFPVVMREESDGSAGDFVTEAIRLLRTATGQDTAACMQILADDGDLLQGEKLARFTAEHGLVAVESGVLAS